MHEVGGLVCKRRHQVARPPGEGGRAEAGQGPQGLRYGGDRELQGRSGLDVGGQEVTVRVWREEGGDGFAGSSRVRRAYVLVGTLESL